MSCQIRLISKISDIEAIKRCLFPTDDLRGSDSWLQNCELSVSPVGDIIAIANERRLVILTCKWDEGSPTSQYHVTFSGSVHGSDNIKAVLCFPNAKQTKSSSHAVPEWTCVMLGFESGFVRFYTENFELLFEEQLHNEIVNSIKCQSQHNPRPDMTPNLFNEEIYVQYQSSICVLSGSQLLPILRNRRSELQRAKSNGEQTWDPASSTQPFNLNPKKWGFQDQTTINDTAVVGFSLPGDFNQLLTTSTYGGFESRYQYSSLSNLVLAAGSQPFLGFHYARVALTMPQLSDVAKVVANKLKSALPGLFGIYTKGPYILSERSRFNSSGAIHDNGHTCSC